MAKKVTNYLETRLNTTVTIDKVDISFFKFIRLENLYVEDLNHDTLFFIRQLDARIDYFKIENDSVIIDLGSLNIDEPIFHLHQNRGDSTANLRFIIDSFTSPDTSISTTQLIFNASKLNITNGSFKWDNDNYKKQDFGIDWEHIGVSKINLDITDFKMVNDSFNAEFKQFSWNEKSGFQVDEFSGRAIFSSTTTTIDHLNIKTPNSDIHANLNYQYDSIGAYADFNHLVYMRYQIDTSQISMTDIAYFAPELKGSDYLFTAYGKERGPVSDMKFQDIYLQYGQATTLFGRVYISGLPDIESTFFSCKFKKLSTNYSDVATIKTYPFTDNTYLKVPEFFENVGITNFTGKFDGFYNNFVTYGTFTNNAGVIKTDLQLAEHESEIVTYKGTIQTTNLDLARITKKPKLFGKASVNIEIEGTNLSFSEMELTVNGHSSMFDFYGYTYTDIEIDGEISDQNISGFLQIIDSNVDLNFDGSINLKNTLPRYQFRAYVDHLRPKQLQLLDQDSSASLTTEVMFNFEGNSIDNIKGRAGLRHFNFTDNDSEVKLDTVDFVAYTTGKGKTMSLRSDNIDLQISGEFYFDEAYESLKYIMYKWLPSAFDEPPIKPESREVFELHLKTQKFSGFSKIFVPQITFKDSLSIDFWFDSETEKIKLESTSNKMFVYGKELVDFSLNAKLTTDTFNLESSTGELHFNDSSYLKNYTIHAQASMDLIKSSMFWYDSPNNSSNSGEVNFDLQFNDPENFHVNFYNSWFEINDTTWSIIDSGKISRNKNEYTFERLVIKQNQQDFKLDGFISENPEKHLLIEVDSFNLKHLNPFIQKYNVELAGVLDGEIQIQDFYNDLKIYSNSNFNSLIFNNQKIGDGEFISEWNDPKERFDINIAFTNDTLKTIDLHGSYHPNKKNNQLDLKVELTQFPIKIIEPFADEFISDLEGTISGTATINGDLRRPQFNGGFELNNLSTKVMYLNETLKIDKQHIFIIPDLIGADGVIITDEQGKKAEMNFSLFHQNFDSINMDFSVTSINQFKAFNTTKVDNDYFYGDIFLSPGSTIGIETDYDGNLTLIATIKTGQGTKVVIPMYDDDEVQQNDYIYFVDFDALIDSISESVEVITDESNINLNMSISLTPDAEIELIFDEFSADKIKAKGEGLITLLINDENDFSIYGNYEITEGNYLFTFSKIISKNFIINPNSHITWNGDPYTGQANITASYKVRTTLYELGIPTADSNRVPVDVLLTMTGDYMDPNLKFSFILPPKYDEVQSLLNTLDEGERNKQVFALLILNKFMPINGANISSGSSMLATNSSEVLSNQLSGWLSKINDDVDVGFRYSPGSNITADEVEIALSTQLFNDRVLFETNVGITGNSTNATNTRPNNLVGEFTISYKINKKGNIVGKVFNRSNELNPVYQNISPYTQGVGIAYSEPYRSINDLGCILSNHFKKTDNKRDCEAEYRADQFEHADENYAKVQRRVERSRKKQQNRKERTKRRENRLAKKESNEE